MSKKYDSLVIGPVSLDHNIDYDGREEYIAGGLSAYFGVD